MVRRCFLIVAFFTVLIAALAPETGRAIPAFARKYGFSCSTCHVAVPKLKSYGDEFAGNGYQLPDADEPPRAFKDAGDDRLLLQRELPLAIRFDAYARFQTEGKIKSDFQMPFGLKLMSGGNIAKNVGYYFYFYMSELGEMTGVEDAFIYFNNIGGTELDFLAGQFQLCDPLYKRELRLTYEDYQIYTTRVGQSNANLTYDRGFILSYSLPTKTDLVLQVVNGNGIGMAEDDLTDNDNFKNVFLKVSQDISIVNIGMFGYTGQEKTDVEKKEKNKFYMVGPNLTVSTDRIEFNTQYVARSDDNPDFLPVKGDKIKTDGFFGELIVNPFPAKSRIFGILLYNKVNSDYDGLEYETVTVNLSYMLHTNMRVMAEVTRDIENEQSRFVVGYVSGF
ncbi:hypothetical protein LLG96_16855 [bacterium]|nr:hypothetical protein [bacterium]